MAVDTLPALYRRNFDGLDLRHVLTVMGVINALLFMPLP